jgi:quinol monooxygenase YgiN
MGPRPPVYNGNRRRNLSPRRSATQSGTPVDGPIGPEREGVAVVSYGYIGSMKTKPGHREDVLAILLSGAAGLREAGCDLYLVTVSNTDDVTIWVSEVWQSKEHHDASLQLPETRAAIAKAMPNLTGEFSTQEVTVRGGLGAPPA